MANVAEISRNITAKKWLLNLIMFIDNPDTRSLMREKKRKKLEIGVYNSLSKSFAMKERQKEGNSWKHKWAKEGGFKIKK